MAFHAEEAVSIGAIKKYDEINMEVKRMYTSESHRGKGLAKKVLAELENWAAELGYERCILETGFRQHAAISLYNACKYEVIPNYGQYQGIENSLCFEKILAEEKSISAIFIP